MQATELENSTDMQNIKGRNITEASIIRSVIS